MKTAVSLPDSLFEEADRLAQRLHVTRSELYARAIAAFIREHSGATITAAINRALGNGSPALDESLAHLQSRSLGPDEGTYEDWVERPTGAGRASERRTKKRRRG